MNKKSKDQKPAPKKHGAKDQQPSDNDKKHQDELLDEGVEETFPASDPIAVRITK